MIDRGSLYWVDLGEAHGSKPAKRRPVLIIQANALNSSRLNTTLAAMVTYNTAQAALPGNVFIPAAVSGLPRNCVLTVTALVTVDEADLAGPVGRLPDYLMEEVERGLRRVMAL